MIIRVKIDIQGYHFHALIQREIDITHARRRRLSGDNGDGIVSMRREPIYLLSQHPLHTTGIIEMRYAIQEIHTFSSFLFPMRFSQFTICS